MTGRRLFLALPVPLETANRIADWAAQGLDAEYFRFVPAEQMHVTLVFFGERSPEEVETITGLVRQIEWQPLMVQTGPLRLYSRSALASQMEADTLDHEHLNKRLGWGQYRFVLDENYAQRTEQALSEWSDFAAMPLGRLCHEFTTAGDLERRRRRHRHSQPLDLHLTVARLRTGAMVPSELPTPPVLCCSLDRLVLFESRLQPGGSVYSEVAESRR